MQKISKVRNKFLSGLKFAPNWAHYLNPSSCTCRVAQLIKLLQNHQFKDTEKSFKNEKNWQVEEIIVYLN